MQGRCSPNLDALSNAAAGVVVPLADGVGSEPDEIAEIDAGGLEVVLDVVERESELLDRDRRDDPSVVMPTCPEITSRRSAPLISI